MKVYKLKSGIIIGVLEKPIFLEKLYLNTVILSGIDEDFSDGTFFCWPERNYSNEIL